MRLGYGLARCIFNHPDQLFGEQISQEHLKLIHIRDAIDLGPISSLQRFIIGPLVSSDLLGDGSRTREAISEADTKDYVRHHPRSATIAIVKWVNPVETP